jgi:hypothetical protein
VLHPNQKNQMRIPLAGQRSHWALDGVLKSLLTKPARRTVMGDIRMTGEIRTDYDCESTGLPAERWAEAVFKIGDEELVFEISVEKDVVVAIMIGEDAAWRGTLKGLKQFLKGEIKAG